MPSIVIIIIRILTKIGSTYFPSVPMCLPGLKISGLSKYLPSFMMNAWFAINTEPAGKVKPDTAVGAVVLWNNEIGATLDSLCTSAIVA